MKTKLLRGFTVASIGWLAVVSASAQPPPEASSALHQSEVIPIEQLGVVASKQYQGDGLSVTATSDGAQLCCAFQRLEGLVTRKGLWLSSTADSPGDRFRVVAVAVGRTGDFSFGEIFATQDVFGVVKVTDKMARFIRPSLTEEYSVSVDGVRQDFIVKQRPLGEGELRVELDVTGAKAEPMGNGARLVLDGSGRKLAYNRLRVIDARGQELTARLEVTDTVRLAIVANDANAVYPVRIDPTFSDDDWVSFGGIPGANSTVYSAAFDNAGNLYIGGNFTVVAEILANRVAKWDGSKWSALGSGIGGDVFDLFTTVNSLVISGTNLYAGGRFNTAGGLQATNVAKWNGSAWSALGLGVAGYAVESLAASGTNLYAGGSVPGGVVKWTGSSWTSLGSGTTISVNALAALGNEVFAGGYTGAARWNGNTWSSMGSEIVTLSSFTIFGTNLYAGAYFRHPSGTNAFHVVEWNGFSWSAVSPGMDGAILTLASSGTNLYAGGYFTSVGGTLIGGLTCWNGSSWTPMGSGMNGWVHALAASATNLCAGGSFNSAGGTPVDRVAKWNGSQWSALGSGMNNYVNTLATSGADLYVGGTFSGAGGTSANRIARWDGNTWSALGSGMDARVLALVVSGTNLYAGGTFTNAGGTIVNGIARWNGSDWSALNFGMNSGGEVHSLAVSGPYLYAGGRFHTAGGIASTNVAKWNGNTWSALGDGTDDKVVALAVFGTDLYAAGWFDHAGGVMANSIAKWNGMTWSAVGSGVDGGNDGSWGITLLALGTNLYFGGNFTVAGGITANYIAKWDGNVWSALGSGMNNWVVALASDGTNLYAAGPFTTAGGTPASGIAKWDGTNWSPMGSGIINGLYGPEVLGLAVSGQNLYAGGNFTLAGGKVTAYMARANISGLPLPGRFTNLSRSPASGFTCTFLDASIGQPYRIQTSPSLAAGSWTDFTNFTYTGPISITNASALSGTNKFFRAVTP